VRNEETKAQKKTNPGSTRQAHNVREAEEVDGSLAHQDQICKAQQTRTQTQTSSSQRPLQQQRQQASRHLT
jgi:hypothetical protein